MSKPKPPCGRDCPRRRPGCHNRKTCPEWGTYEDACAADKAQRAKHVRCENDFAAIKKEGIRRWHRRKGDPPIY